MKQALIMAPKASVIGKFNNANINALKKLGYKVFCMSNFSDDEYSRVIKDRLENSGVSTYDLPFVRASLINNIQLVPKIRRILKNGKFNLIHCQTETGGLLIRLSKSALKSAKYVYTPHGMSFYKGSSLFTQLIYRPIEHWICSSMNAIIGINAEEFQILRKWNNSTGFYTHGVGLDIKKIEACTNIGSTKKDEFFIPQKAFVVLSVGELNDNKNHATIVKAISKIPENIRPYYVICGKGEKEKELKSLAKKSGIEKYVILAGHRDDINEILDMADLFVFPSFHEGLSVALMEAMAKGLPIVCSNIRGNVDLISDFDGGILVRPDDIIGFSDAIERMILDKNTREQYSIRNKQYVQKYSVDGVKNELIEIYDDI